MKPIFLYENKKYKIMELASYFNPKDIDAFISECNRRGIALMKQEIISFKYVGIMIYNHQLILFLPKYLQEPLAYREQFRIMKQLINVLKVYSKGAVDEENLDFLSDFLLDGPFNFLSAIDYFINDYIENGLYQSDKIEYVLYGNGEVDWQQTIDYQVAYLSKDQTPVYLDYITEEILVDQKHKIIQIQKSILNECTEYLESTGLDEFLDHPLIHFPIDEHTAGNKDYKLKVINDALYQDFNDRNTILLKCMYNYIAKEKSPLHEEGIVFFGTKSFHIIWEKCCASVMGHDESIAKNIAKPIWENSLIKDKNKDTLIPDIVRKLIVDSRKNFFIIDAKYYNISFTNSRVVHNPGIEDIMKQYMYEKALHQYIEVEGIEQWYNVFVFPSSNSAICKIGQVSIDFLADLKSILLITLPAEKIYDLYLSYQKWTTNEWNLFIKELR